jgi:hypothetical protein
MMSIIFRSIVALSTVSLLASCTQPIHKTVDIDQGRGLSIDAKQRLILVTNNGPDGKRVVCAEPSPDALTAQAAAIAAQGGTPEIGVGFGAGSSEAAAAIGLRTQTIQLLRDGYYRLCEAYLNEVVSKEQYNLTLAGIDDLMVKLLAIDAIAGAPRTTTIAISPAVPSVSGSQSFSQTAAAGGAGASPSANSSGSVTVTGIAGLQTIDAIAASKGITADEAKVLLSAVEMSGRSQTTAFCMSLFADPKNAWYDAKYTVSDQSSPVKHIKDFCLHTLTAARDSTMPKALSISTLESEVARLSTQVDHSTDEAKKLRAEVKNLETNLDAALARSAETLAAQPASLVTDTNDGPIVGK